MTIVQVEDKRNKQWTKSSIGSKLLKSMGWKEGEGLGKRQQGSNTALRAVKMKENIGIGADNDDVTGSQGWDQTANGFASVLSSLQAQHTTIENSKKKKKKKKKLILAKNKVTAGHSRKMRESKDLATKSESDMAAIFGVTLNNKLPKKKKKRKRDESSKDSSSNEKEDDDSVSSSTKEQKTTITKVVKEEKNKEDCKDNDTDSIHQKKRRKKEKKKEKKEKKDKKKLEKKEKKKSQTKR